MYSEKWTDAITEADADPRYCDDISIKHPYGGAMALSSRSVACRFYESPQVAYLLG